MSFLTFMTFFSSLQHESRYFVTCIFAYSMNVNGDQIEFI